MGDATCCLLTCEEMIAHHLITTIHNGAACEVKTIHLSYQATNFASVFFLQDRIGSDRDKNFRSLDGTGSAKIVKADNNQ